MTVLEAFSAASKARRYVRPGIELGSTMMNCQELEENLPLLLYGELSPWRASGL